MTRPPASRPDPARGRVVSVVVPVRDAATTIGRTMDAVLSQDGVDEVVLAVAPSRDGTAEVVADIASRDPRVRVVDNPAGSTPAALNRAVAASTGDVVVRVDAHAVLPAGYVAAAVRLLSESGAANVGGRQVPTADDGFAAAVAAAMTSPVGSGGAAYRGAGEVRDVDTVYLGVFDRAALDAVGGFDETMLRNQDAELNERLRRAGHRVVLDPDLAVAYAPRDTLRGLARQYFEYGRYRRRTVALHPGSMAPRQAAPALLVGVLSLVLGRGLVRRRAGLATTVLGGYAGALLVAGAVADRRRPFAVAAALATMHLAWGVGFLLGPPRDGITSPR